jgi:hypothetical protein
MRPWLRCVEGPKPRILWLHGPECVLEPLISCCMEKICKNCKHFIQRSIGISSDPWGECMKAKDSLQKNRKTNPHEEHGVFKWADSTCQDFEYKDVNQ